MTDQPVIEVHGVWKIFCPRAEEWLKAINREGLTKSGVLERSGCVVGCGMLPSLWNRARSFASWRWS